MIIILGLFVLDFSIEPICIPPDKLINCRYIQVYAYPGKACGILIMEVISYEDALGHEQFLMNQCQEAIQNLQDPALKNQAQQMEQKHKQIFDSFYNLV